VGLSEFGPELQRPVGGSQHLRQSFLSRHVTYAQVVVLEQEAVNPGSARIRQSELTGPMGEARERRAIAMAQVDFLDTGSEALARPNGYTSDTLGVDSLDLVLDFELGVARGAA